MCGNRGEKYTVSRVLSIFLRDFGAPEKRTWDNREWCLARQSCGRGQSAIALWS